MKILETNNYSKFVVSPFNRDVRKTKALEESFLKYGWLPAYPLHVRRLENGKLEIIAGHHRFCVAQKLGMDIKYIEDKTFSEQMLHDLEIATTPWTLKDWLMSHERTGKREYGVIYEYHKRTGISLGQCISLLSVHGQNGRTNNMFKEGTLQLSRDLSLADTVGKIIIRCKSIGIPFARDRQFVVAVTKVAMADGFDLETMLNKMDAHKALMQDKKASQKDYVRLLDKIFNRNSKAKIPLAFNAEEAVRQRALAQIVPEKYSGKSRGESRQNHLDAPANR